MVAQHDQGERAAADTGYGENLTPGARSPARYEAGAEIVQGRQFDEPNCPTRSPFQRDRDRVLHSTAFRRLTHKTQVFIYHEGDHYRSRLTHSLEVAQVARTIARQLRLNEDLAECLSLAHDLGHPPFGHAGERALDQLMKDHGGFDHNAQSLRIVMKLEKKYTAFDGLNLTWTVIEGLAKHNGPIADKNSPIGTVMADLADVHGFNLAAWPSAEAQVAALSDDVAYLTHDVDDGLRAGLISVDDLCAVPLLNDIVTGLTMDAQSRLSDQPYEVVRHLITMLIEDMVGESRRRLRALAPAGPEDIRGAGRGVIGFSPPMTENINQLRQLLFASVYRSNRVMDVMRRAETIVADLFAYYAAQDGTKGLPTAWQGDNQTLSEPQRLRRVADYLSGMTDRFALTEHRRLFDATPDLS